MNEQNTVSLDARVMKADGTGVRGIVISISDDHHNKGDASERGIIIGVQWDNGTLSYVTPDALRTIN